MLRGANFHVVVERTSSVQGNICAQNAAFPQTTVGGKIRTPGPIEHPLPITTPAPIDAPAINLTIVANQGTGMPAHI